MKSLAGYICAIGSACLVFIMTIVFWLSPTQEAIISITLFIFAAIPLYVMDLVSGGIWLHLRDKTRIDKASGVHQSDLVSVLGWLTFYFAIVGGFYYLWFLSRIFGL